MARAKRRVAPHELQSIPGVGASLAQDLRDLGYEQVSQLRGADPEHMYQLLCVLRGEHIDRCVLYVFRCATYYANHAVHDPERLKWWRWKDADPPRATKAAVKPKGRS
jgi:hypothetical protein